MVARLTAEHLRVKLGQPVIIDNKPGANGLLAASEVARAPADGYTLLAINSSGLMINPLVYRKAGYQLSDFTPVTMYTSFPFFLVTNAANPRTASVKSLTDFIALARAKPGELRYGSGGIGNFGSLAFEMLAGAADFKITHVPYKGTQAAQAGLLGQEVDALFDTPLTVPQVKAGRLNALAVTSAKRWGELPDVPAVQEAGVRNFDLTVWLALMAPAQTPPAVVEAIHAALAGIRDDPNLVRQLQAHGTLELTPPRDFAARLKTESAMWADLIRRQNIQLD
ncbi:MAG TPA: tripartite tricarboxylate transporter substrate binding protein [Burkholderiaceae bacterium]|nr:tripartite tricarboxylate transporter substrate binding protein [Burkholderiaceae bacterium]